MSNYINLMSNQHVQLEGGRGEPLINTQFLSGMMPTTNRQQRPAYKTVLALRLAILQILNGALSIICGMIILILRTYLYFTGIGIGSGGVFLAAGVMGVISARNRATWAIVSCMVLSIVSAVACGVTIIASSEGVYLNYIGHPFYEINNENVLKTGIAMDSILIISSLMEIVAAIFQATLCCKVTCCTGPDQPDIMVVYVPQQMSGSDVTPVPAPVVMYPANQQPAYIIPPSNQMNA